MQNFMIKIDFDFTIINAENWSNKKLEKHNRIMDRVNYHEKNIRDYEEIPYSDAQIRLNQIKLLEALHELQKLHNAAINTL